MKMKKCDFCGDIASYDAKTSFGGWAYFCDICFGIYGTDTYNILPEEVERCNEGKEVEAVCVSDLEMIMMDNVMDYRCPLCGTDRQLEFDLPAGKYTCKCGAIVKHKGGIC